MKITPPTLSELDCLNYHELCERVKFQDWVTRHYGIATITHRNELWAKFKRGRLVVAANGGICYLERGRI